MASRVRRVVEADLSNVEFDTSEDVEIIPTFDAIGLREDLLRGIYAYGEFFFLGMSVGAGPTFKPCEK